MAAMAAISAAVLVACSAGSVQDAAIPGWLQQRISAYEAGPEHESAAAIWQIRHEGAIAYYVVAPCCDQFNPLWNAKGDTLCHPSGGFAGHGDGKCPAPKDAGSEARLLWSDPRKPAPTQAPL
jgi:hypothetical protein